MKTPRFAIPSSRTVLGHAVSLLVFLGGFALSFLLAFAFIRGVLHGPQSAWSYLSDPDGKMGVGELAWTMLLSVVGGVVMTALAQKLLVKVGILSQQQVDDSWKE